MHKETISFEGLGAFNTVVNLDTYSQIFILCDQNTDLHCLPILDPILKGRVAKKIIIPAGEKFKTLDTCQAVWNFLLLHGADRHSLLINLGGGVVGDLGGFCASTYMRGMSYVQLPTTLLAQVDASVGGKTGVDFLRYKNIIGVFGQADATIIDSVFLKTLPMREFDSGMVEVLKHALIADQQAWTLLKESQKKDLDVASLVKESVAIKQNIVEKDPFESGQRKALNFGHTVGHALENHALSQHVDIRHGEAVAFGILVAAHLSMEYTGLSSSAMDEIMRVVAPYMTYVPEKDDADMLIQLLRSDKKHVGTDLRFTLLSQIGHVEVDQTVKEASIKNSILQIIEWR